MTTHAHKAASSIAASMLAMEVRHRKLRYGPANLEQRAITEALAMIVKHLRLGGRAGERVEDRPKKRSLRRAKKDKGKR